MSTTTEARAKFHDKLATATDDQLIFAALASTEGKTEEARMVAGHSCQELYRRHPECRPAITAWSDDLDDETEMIDVLLATMTEVSA